MTDDLVIKDEEEILETDEDDDLEVANDIVSFEEDEEAEEEVGE